MKSKSLLFSLALLSTLTPLSNLYAIGCADYKEFEKRGEHYYTVTLNRLEFLEAKQIAEDQGGYIAIPNDQSENDYIQSLIGAGRIGWIGAYDPNYVSNYCFIDTPCAYDDSRFVDIKNNSLSYKNFAQYQPDNQTRDYDVVDDKAMVSPLGENWIAMSGTNGLWADYGNHREEFKNPIKYSAVFEFDSLPNCYTSYTDDNVTWTTKKCNTQIYDSTIGTLTPDNTYDCQTDIYDNTYCPEALAECGESFDYEDGYSVAFGSTFSDTVDKVELTTTELVSPIQQLQVRSAHWQEGVSTDSDWIDIVYKTNDMYVAQEPYYSGGWQTRWVVKNYSFSVSLGRANVTGFRYYNGSLQIRSAHWQEGVSTDSDWIDIAYLTNDMYVAQEPYYSGGWQTRWVVKNYSFSVSLGRANVTGFRLQVQCPDGSTPVNGQCPITTTALQCPTTHPIDNGDGTCSVTVPYTYYEYLCSDSPNSQLLNFIPTDSGGNCDPLTELIDTNGDGVGDSCNSSTPPVNNCSRQKFLCQANAERPCSYVDSKWQCSPFPCIGVDDTTPLGTPVGTNDKKNDGWGNDGACNGQIYIFSGKDNRCRSWDAFLGLAGGGCCDKDKVFFGLVPCKAEEKKLAKLQMDDLTHYVGEYCSRELDLLIGKICIEKKKSHCSFNSKLALAINEQGRPQLGKGWGSGDNPQCAGFTPDEFQKIDFSKIDLSVLTADITSQISTVKFNNMGNFVQDKVVNFFQH